MCDRIVLFAKQPGKTSFSSLFTIKHAFNTQKVGHTGTLDSFASGLLVVCCGALTRLAGRITEFDKTYEAVLCFGTETDTLEYTGKVVRTAPLPQEEKLIQAVENFTGEIMQKPPLFSAIHVNGKRASDLARSGVDAEIPVRKVNVYSSEILEIQKNSENLVEYARIRFTVSKGTYIRSLARDIGVFCGSASHLTGLLRTKVGAFELKNAAGYSYLPEFNIQNAILISQGQLKDCDHEQELQKIVRNNSEKMSPQLASYCGFSSLTLKKQSEKWFYNGGKLASSMFNISPFTIQNEFAAVFTEENEFAGLLQKDKNGYFKYSFVVHKN